MYFMFYDAQTFNQDLSEWDVSAVHTLPSMFEDATAFNQDMSKWCDMLPGGDMSRMFVNSGCPGPILDCGMTACYAPKP